MRPSGSEPEAQETLEAQEAQFFAEGERLHEPVDGSLAPAAHDAPELDDWDHAPPPSLSPALLLRRARLRRAVAVGLFAGGSLLSIAIVAARSRQASVEQRPSVSSALLLTRGRTPEGPRVRDRTAARAEPGLATVSSAKPPPSAEPASSAEPLPSSAEPSSGEPAPEALDPTLAHALTREARALLQGGRTRDGVARARAALEADPDDAEPYILLAAGLEDLGRWGEAQSVFIRCVHRSQSAKSGDCAYFARTSR